MILIYRSKSGFPKVNDIAPLGAFLEGQGAKTSTK